MSYENRGQKRRTIKWLFVLPVVLIIGGFAFYFLTLEKSIEERIDDYLITDDTVTSEERSQIESYIFENEIKIGSNLNVSADIADELNPKHYTNTYVIITDLYSTESSITPGQVNQQVYFDNAVEEESLSQLAESLGVEISEISRVPEGFELSENSIVVTSAGLISPSSKLLRVNDEYYLDQFNKGAFFRSLVFQGEDSSLFDSLTFAEPQSEDSVLKMNITGVTALTRVMMRKLNEVKDPLYFSQNIGEFLAEADITHVSNEVSFKESCTYSSTLFCSPPEFIETLKASGVDLVELTGNHNNDFGSEPNTATINQYSELGWETVGGGLNLEDARKPAYFDQDGTKVAMLAYNYPDAPNGGAIAGISTAGANPFDFSFTQIEQDIASAKEQSEFVIVNIQYWECYAYPDGYLEYPECDLPIGDQEEVFKRVADLGADMVVGSSAHQPQTYELYNGVPIYYGLGNLYFDQTSWPGTERGLVLTNYFYSGQLLQTKITPTVYNESLQTRVMTAEEAKYQFERLNTARLSL